MTTTTIERDLRHEQISQTPQLWVVMIDLAFGGEFGPAEWVENSDPQELSDALDEANKVRRNGWTVKIVPA